MKTLSYMTGVFLASSLICGAAFADYDDEEFVSTFGFESQQKFTPEEEQYRQIRKQANGRAVSSNLMEKNVMGNESKQKLHADRARLRLKFRLGDGEELAVPREVSRLDLELFLLGIVGNRERTIVDILGNCPQQNHALAVRGEDHRRTRRSPRENGGVGGSRRGKIAAP